MSDKREALRQRFERELADSGIHGFLRLWYGFGTIQLDGEYTPEQLRRIADAFERLMAAEDFS